MPSFAPLRPSLARSRVTASAIRPDTLEWRSNALVSIFRQREPASETERAT